MAKEIFSFTSAGCLVVQRGSEIELIADEGEIRAFLDQHYDPQDFPTGVCSVPLLESKLGLTRREIGVIDRWLGSGDEGVWPLDEEKLG